EGEVEPVGARKPLKVDVRLISATNRDLIADVKASRFREDLFYRLHVFPIAVPPLSERPEDIPELMRHFLARFAAEEGKRATRVSAEALALLSAYRWPGNVRQLENAVFRAVVLADGDAVGIGESRQIATQSAGSVPTARVARDFTAGETAAADPAPTESLAAAVRASPPVAPSVAPAPAPVAPPIGTLALLDGNGD